SSSRTCARRSRRGSASTTGSRSDSDGRLRRGPRAGAPPASRTDGRRGPRAGASPASRTGGRFGPRAGARASPTVGRRSPGAGAPRPSRSRAREPVQAMRATVSRVAAARQAHDVATLRALFPEAVGNGRRLLAMPPPHDLDREDIPRFLEARGTFTDELNAYG